MVHGERPAARTITTAEAACNCWTAPDRTDSTTEAANYCNTECHIFDKMDVLRRNLRKPDAEPSSSLICQRSL